MPVLSQNLSDLFERMGLSGLAAGEKQKYIEEWSSMIQDAVMLRIWDGLPEEDRKQLDALNGDEFDAFLAEKVPGLDAIVAEETIKFREGLIADSSYIQGRLSQD